MSADFTSVSMLIVCFAIIYLFIWVFIKPIKLIFKILANSIIGSAVLILFNYAGTFFSISLGVNVYSSLICGILGIPGLIMLILGKMFIT